MGSCFYSMTQGNEDHKVLGNCAIPNTPFSIGFDTRRGDKTKQNTAAVVYMITDILMVLF